MITGKELRRLNRILADNLGRTPYGHPLYKWVQNQELKYPRKKSEEWVLRNGIHVAAREYEWEPQMPHIGRLQWVLAKWIPPGTMETWVDSYGNGAGYPSQGLYYCTDIILRPEHDPSELATSDAIGKVKAFRSAFGAREITLQDVIDRQRAAEARDRLASENEIDAYLASKLFLNIPGTRSGSVSFPEARPGHRR